MQEDIKDPDSLLIVCISNSKRNDFSRFGHENFSVHGNIVAKVVKATEWRRRRKC